MRYYGAKIRLVREAAESTELIVSVPKDALAMLQKRQCNEIQVGIDDGRTISPAQRRKAYATLGDISNHTGYTVEAAKEIMKVEHMLRNRSSEILSLADCTVTEAREFINTLLEYALKEGIILTESGLRRTDDIDTYLIQCIRYRRCCVCGQSAEIHHVDAIGMGHDRRHVDDSCKRIAALCRKHHTIAHQKGWERFADSYKVYGIERCRIEDQEVEVVNE